MREQFISLATKLKQDARLEVTHYSIGPAIPHPLLEELISGTPFESVIFSQSDMALLGTINGFQLEWNVKNYEKIVPYETRFEDVLFGRIWLYDLYELIDMNLTGKIQPIFNLPVIPTPFPYFPVDFFHPDYSGCALFELKNSVILKNITIHLNPYGFYPSDITLQQYLNIILHTAGLIGSLKGLMYPEGIEYKQSLHYLQELFGYDNIKNIYSEGHVPI